MFDPSELLGPNLIVKNDKGEVVFSMKRKDQWGPIYYIFEISEDRMAPETKSGFQLAWTLIRGAAERMGIPLYDNSEITEALQARMREVGESEEGRRALKRIADGTDELVFAKDVKIMVYNHATGGMAELRIGISFQGESY